MTLLCTILTGYYALLILAYYIAWKRIPVFKRQNAVPVKLAFSILIPARNEADHIIRCLKHITAQQFPASHYEIIVIDDDSTDQTAECVNQYIQTHPQYAIRLVKTDGTLTTGKKAAITLGIAHAQFEHILLTDADCTREENWLSTIHDFMCQYPSHFIYAPVMFEARSLFEKIQALEFAGLVAIGGAAIELNNPNMCSGSNLMITKEAFYKIGGYTDSEQIATGDDEYLLHQVCKHYPDQIHFLKNKHAMVTTSANNSLNQFAAQRKRWVSASMTYENIWITAILIGAYLFNAAIVYQFIMNPLTGLIMLLVKSLVEGIFLYDVLSFLNRRSYLFLLPLAEPFHILYILIIGLWANIGTYQWKGRKLN